MIDRMLRLLRAVALAFGLLVLTATPVAADPAGPSDFRSEVTGIVPDIDGVDAAIRGGDTFLELTVATGHTVVVLGYQGEPYLRFNPDGTIERNRLSEATYLNEDRKGKGVTIPQEATDADADTEPDWEVIAHGQRYAWHDHRVHWMTDASPQVPRGHRVGGAYDPWRVPIEVDGAQTEVQGILVYENTVSPLPYIGFAVIIAGLLAFYGRRGSLRLPALLLAAVSAAAVVVGWADYRATPGGGNPLLWALPAVALVTAVGAAALARRSAGVVLALASVASLSGWALFRIEALLKPVLPTDLPYALDRTTIALALAVSAGAAYLAVTSGVLAMPSLEDDDPA